VRIIRTGTTRFF